MRPLYSGGRDKNKEKDAMNGLLNKIPRATIMVIAARSARPLATDKNRCKHFLA